MTRQRCTEQDVTMRSLTSLRLPLVRMIGSAVYDRVAQHSCSLQSCNMSALFLAFSPCLKFEAKL